MSTHLQEIKILLEEGPKTNEDLRRALAKKGVFASLDSVRKVCMKAYEKKEIEKTAVKTPQHRNGIAIWSKPGEDPEKIKALSETMKSAKGQSFQFGR